MDEKSPMETVPVAVIVERRRQKTAEMSCSEIMKILRKRAAKAARKEAGVVDADQKK